ncbi:Probable Co/Zn/Cd efflux system membrane fusion protein [hydrothermal vent metagenome]|uniref:Probable Co/Zn/Cd efflux system membrane fusion protein n=1 Tax=hydrothermal vent metagenome TaxID=652676 RepID=A0A3B0XJ29_9ZZZZ
MPRRTCRRTCRKNRITSLIVSIPERLILILPLLPAIALTFALSACSAEEPKAQKETIRPAKIMTVGDPLAGAQRVYPGEVEAGDRSEQAFRVGGELVKLPAKAGSRVKKGQLLAQLDPTDFKLRVDEQQARFDLAQLQFERTDTLVKQQLIPKSDYDKAKSSMLSAKADLRLVKASLAYTELRAPFDGVISKVNVKNHENVRQTEVILVIQTTDNIDITFNLSENILSKLKRGSGKNAQPRVVFDAFAEKTYTTHVKEFDTEADPQTRSYKITLTMAAPTEFIALPGMSVNVHLDFSTMVEKSSASLVVPVEAVFSPEDKALDKRTHKVWKLNTDTMQAQGIEVTIGQLHSQGIEITSGLQPGDQIITAGVNFIKEGQKVKPWIKESGL